MSAFSRNPKILFVLAALAVPVGAGLSAQEPDSSASDGLTVNGALPADLSWPRAAELLRAAFPPRG